MEEKGVSIITTTTGEVKLSPTIIRKHLVRGGGSATDQEVIMFLSLCKYNQLNPFLNEAYLVKFGNQSAQMVIGKEAFLKRAAKCINYKGFRAGVIILGDNQQMELEGTFYLDTDILVGGWAEIHTTNTIPLKHTVSLKEYIGKKKDGSTNSMWKGKPATMIRKVALTQALRETFPEEFQAMYGEEEMNVETKDYKVIDQDKISIGPTDVFENQKQEEIKEPIKEEVEVITPEVIEDQEELAPFLQDENMGDDF